MKVKRYLVGDLPEAVQLIRSELGSDAVILNTKEIRTGGFLGMFRKKRVEVIAAVDEKEAAKPSYRAPAGRPAPAVAATADRAQRPQRPAPSALPAADAEEAQAPMLPPDAIRQRYVGAADSPASSERAAVKAAAPEPSRPAEPAGQAEPPRAKETPRAAEPSPWREAAHAAEPLPPASPPTRAAAPPASPAAEAVSPSVAEALAAALSDSLRGAAQSAAAAPPPAAPKQGEPGETASETAALLAELREMKEWMKRANREQTQRGLPEPVLQLSRRLALQSVEPAYVEQFAEEVTARLASRDEADEETALALATEVLREWLAPAADDGLSGETRIVNFVGPTGVGKTTTIAKLGAEQAFVHRRSVGFITADTYRIAAVDQLRTYADILNVPLEVVFSPSELTRAYKKLEDRDLLFMDTAGRNYRNELFVSEVNSLLAPGQQAETFLVLSLTHKYSDMKQVAGHFAKYGVSRLLLTKMDETDSYGAALNLVKAFGFRIPYVAFGQTVPDDIRRFDAEDLIAKLLGEPADA
ncbi:flagellar biosynthesis protein FlhF [Cohnella nanjingensis]|uniref:Flagellar biosynthesis protein FlhF n=1 Tax=Cohnella nanjingensis TaxID=1387779 RepID=A0A7X0RVW2_9BACL|nr:flagellar biosynthesis protein FlhF [Cohnella nanjingensis]MBB6674613.1 flagellar biosynthesis protein FlhF [Cohnella nanjingensis]